MEVLYFPGASQDVPGYAPPGEYTYWAYAGIYPSSVADSAGFKFTKSGSVNNNQYSNWELNGLLSSTGNNAYHRTSRIQSRCFPNPFNSTTNINYILTEDTHVKLDVFNIAGRRVSGIVDEFQNSGLHSVKWDASDYSSGIYFYRISAGNENLTKRLVLIK
jgi:hypothetical protein